MSALEDSISKFIDERIEARLAAFQPVVEDAEAESLRAKTARILAKEIISIAEARFLLGCTDYQMKKLLERAGKSKTNNPIPFRNLDDVAIVFNPQELLAWSKGEKSKTHLRDVSAR